MSAGEIEDRYEGVDVIPSLMDLLNEKVKAAGVTRREIRTNFPRDPRSISGYLNGYRLPPANEVESLVTAVAVELETDRLQLWQEALDAVKKRAADRDPRQAPAEAARSARLRDQA